MHDFSKLNEEQLRAVTWEGAPLLLLAGPGSGKTFTIVNRILYLLECGISPQNILVITFTKDAAVSMRNRFIESSNKEYPVNFGTFHSVFYHMLQESQGISKCKILTVTQKKQIIIRLIKELSDKQNQRNYDLGELSERLIASISYYKNTEDLGACLRSLPAECRVYFESLLKQYQNYLLQNHLIDFDDMLYRCKKMLQENPDVCNLWKTRFTHILIDEFQDTNPIQYEIIKLIANPLHIFVVGDDDQSIYGFRGAKPNILKEFQMDFHSEILLLRRNYRSKPDIIEKSLQVISENKNRYHKDLYAANIHLKKTCEDAVILRRFSCKEEELSYILSEIIRIKKEKAFDYSCGILFRTNHQIQIYASELEKNHISFSVKEKSKSIYEHFIIKDILSYLKIAKGIGTSEDAYRILNTPNRNLSREAIKNGFSRDKILSWYEDAYLSESQKKQIINQIHLLFMQLNSMGKMSLSLSIQYVLKAINYEGYLRRRAAQDSAKLSEWMEIIALLKRDCVMFPTLSELLLFQQEYTDKMGKNIEEYSKKHMEQVQLMTVHASKGLEFDVVFIPDCNERNFPHGSLLEEETLEEERRLFYVAMTRARETLHLLYQTTEGSTRKQISRFLLSIKNDYEQSS